MPKGSAGRMRLLHPSSVDTVDGDLQLMETVHSILYNGERAKALGINSNSAMKFTGSPWTSYNLSNHFTGLLRKKRKKERKYLGQPEPIKRARH